MRFLAADGPGGSPDVLIRGAPYDGGISWRDGAAQAPDAIRVASDSIESYSPLQDRDLRDVSFADAGNIVLPAGRGAPVIDAIADATEADARTARTVVTIGGDHSISMGTAAGLRRVHGDLMHVVFDAHLDLRDDYEGDRYSHACGTRRMAAAGPTCVLGVRSGSREEFADARDLLAAFSEDAGIPDAIADAMGDRPVFISVDMDVLDPSELPGTGNPEPAGTSFRALRAALLGLRGRRVVGLDVCEVSPPLDPTGRSPVIAAALLRECILAFAP